jgi:RimJ/RimL family protein N-acetyltransferase
MLLLHHLSTDPPASTATLAIDFDNHDSMAIARRAGFVRHGDLPSSTLWKKPIPSGTYSDGTVTIRPFRLDDLDRDLEAKDDEQIGWLWLPGQRESWEAMTPEEQRAHARRGIEAHLEDPRTGPKWSFVIDVGGRYAGYVDCDLANPNVEAGEANISYSSHPDVRGKGYVSRGVRLILRFLAEHTGARTAVIGVDERNEASLRVARAVRAVETTRYVDAAGHRMVRHDVLITR